LSEAEFVLLEQQQELCTAYFENLLCLQKRYRAKCAQITKFPPDSLCLRSSQSKYNAWRINCLLFFPYTSTWNTFLSYKTKWCAFIRQDKMVCNFGASLSFVVQKRGKECELFFHLKSIRCRFIVYFEFCSFFFMLAV